MKTDPAALDSHLATALGYAACQQGISVLFATAIDVVNTLSAAQLKGTLKAELRRCTTPALLVLDEVGYLPIDQHGADLLFQVISARYERGSIVLTTNKTVATNMLRHLVFGHALFKPPSSCAIRSAALNSRRLQRSRGVRLGWMLCMMAWCQFGLGLKEVEGAACSPH